jgi:hypothetical protein
MDAQLKIAKAAIVPGLLAGAGVLFFKMLAPEKTAWQLAAAALGGIVGAIAAANLGSK